jgi:hypothetical protein
MTGQPFILNCPLLHHKARPSVVTALTSTLQFAKFTSMYVYGAVARAREVVSGMSCLTVRAPVSRNRRCCVGTTVW